MSDINFGVNLLPTVTDGSLTLGSATNKWKAYLVDNYITGMTILSYGSSTWQNFLDAYNANTVVYCRASSNSNPGSGAQNRMAFLAYVNNATTPTEAEFQYYRSVATHSDSQQGDQVYVYKINSSGTWSVTVRSAFSKVAAGTGLSSSYSTDTVTLSIASAYRLPAVTSSDNGKALIVSSGTWSAQDLPAASTSTPLVAGTASAGSETAWARGDHVHPSELPSVTSSDNGKALMVSSEAWVVSSLPAELPSVTSSDNGKVLSVASGVWSANTLTAATTSANGLMSSTDKTKLDGIEIATISEIQTYFSLPTYVSAQGVNF